MSNDAKKEAAPADAPPAAGGGGASKIGAALAVVNLLLTLGIGGVVFTQFQKDKKKESVADIQEHADAPAAEGGEHGEAKKEEGHGEKPAEAAAGEHGGGEHGEKPAAKPGPKVVSLDQFTVNLSTSPGTPARFARVIIAIELPSEETATELTQKTPQVRNAVIDLFNSKRPTDLQTGEGRNFLKEEIKNALNSFLITGKVKGVFFSNFQVSGG
jgi:flagellar basal body-associated protein FliL